MKQGLKTLFGILLAALLLWVVLRGVDPAACWDAAKKASIPGLILGGLLLVSHNVFRVLRWRALLHPVKAGLPFRTMFSAVLLGYFTTWLIPGRLGEVVRPMYLSARERVPLGPCLGTVLVDRLMDGAAIVVLFALGSWWTPLSAEAAEHATLIRTASYSIVAIVAVSLAFWIAVSASDRLLSRWLEGRSRVLRWVGRTALSLSHGVRALRSPALLLPIAVHSVLAWLTIAFGTWVAILATGVRVPFGSVLVILPMLALGVAIPTPAGAGSYHGAMKYGLMLFGVAAEPAVSAAILVHAANVVPVLVTGLLLAWIERVSWRDLVSAARQLKGIGADAAAPAEHPVEGTP